jgi:anti-sigma28 factor (negative regulator of flagellin synthesis)
MHGPAAADDEALKMSLTLHTSTPDQFDRLLSQAVSRLDGELGTIASPDPEQSPVRTRTVLRMRTLMITGEYVVDAAAVADAIVDRVRPTGHATWRHLRAA